MIHVAGNNQQRWLRLLTNHFRQATGKIQALLLAAPSQGNADDPRLRCQLGQQGQFYFDRMFLLVGRSIQL